MRHIQIAPLGRRAWRACSTSDPFATLGISRTATSEEVKAAFRERAKEVHPDAAMARGVSEDVANHNFKSLAAAHDLLRDPARRAAWERGGKDAAMASDAAATEAARTVARWERRARERRRRRRTLPSGRQLLALLGAAVGVSGVIELSKLSVRGRAASDDSGAHGD
jgi:curved DNA-binding protein CbpA